MTTSIVFTIALALAFDIAYLILAATAVEDEEADVSPSVRELFPDEVTA